MLKKAEKKAYLFEKARGCCVGKTQKGFLQMQSFIGVAPGQILRGVCRKSFFSVYGIGHSYLDDIYNCIKTDDRNADASLNDNTPSLGNEFVKILVALTESFHIHLTPVQLSALVLPNTQESLSCFAWMKSYFDAVGDKQSIGGLG